MGRNGGNYVKMDNKWRNFGEIWRNWIFSSIFPHFPPFSPIVPIFPHFSSIVVPVGHPHPQLVRQKCFLGGVSHHVFQVFPIF